METGIISPGLGGAVRKRSRFDKRAIVPWLLPLALLVTWQVVSMAGWIPAYIFPSPSDVIDELRDMADNGSLWGHIRLSVLRLLGGFLLGSVAGTVLGAVAGYLTYCRLAYDGLLQGLRSVPVIAWVPLFVLWIGIGEGSKIALIGLGAFFPVYLNLVSGVQSVDRKLVEIGRANRLTGLRLIRKIYFPATLPSYLLGLRVGMGLSWMFVAAAELIGASEGLGYLLSYGQSTGRPALIIAAMGLFAVGGKLTDLALAQVSRRLLRWQDTVPR